MYTLFSPRRIPSLGLPDGMQHTCITFIHRDQTTFLNIFKNIFWRVEITATCFTLLPNHQPPQSIDTCVFLYISAVVFFIHSDSLSFFGFIFIFFSTSNNPISIDWVVFDLIFFYSPDFPARRFQHLLKVDEHRKHSSLAVKMDWLILA